MTDAYDDWIRGMSEKEYEDRLDSDVEDGGFTDRQKELALNIRTPLSEDEEEIYEREQYYVPESGTRVIETRVANKTIITKPEAPVEVKSKSPIVITRIQDASRQLPPTGTAPTMPRPTVIFPRGTKPSVIRRFFALFRRRRK